MAIANDKYEDEVTVTSLAAGATITLPHGIVWNHQAAKPNQILPDRATPIKVISANTTSITFLNPSSTAQTSIFEVELTFSTQRDPADPDEIYWQGIALDQSDAFLDTDFLLYVSVVDGKDSNSGFALDIPLTAGGVAQSATASAGTPTTVTLAGVTMLANAYVGKEVRIVTTIAPSVADSQARKILSNTATTITIDPAQFSGAFSPTPLAGDTVIIADPVKTFNEAISRRPPAWGKRCNFIWATEGGPLTGQAGAAASIIAGATAPSYRVSGLTGMTVNSVGNMLSLRGCATGSNNGDFEILAFVSATSVDIANPNGVAPDANNGLISWTEVYQYVTNDRTTNASGEFGLGAGGDGTQYQKNPMAFIGGFKNELGNQVAAAGTGAAAVVATVPFALPTGVVTIVAPLTSAQVPPAGGQLLTSSVALTPGAHKGRSLLMTSGAASGTSREIVDNTATTFTVTPSFPTVGPQGPIVAGVDTFVVDLSGELVLMIDGPAAGQRRQIREITGGTTIVPNALFSPAPVAGNTFRIESPSAKVSYLVMFDIYGAKNQKGMKYIANAGGSLYVDAGGPIQGVEGCQWALRNTTFQVARLGNFFAGSNRGLTDVDYIDIGQDIFVNARTPSGAFMRDGNCLGILGAQLLGYYVFSNMTVAMRENCIAQFNSLNGIQTSMFFSDNSLFQHIGETTLRGRIARSKSTSIADGIINILGSSFATAPVAGNVPAPLNNLDLRSGEGFGMRISEFGKGNLGNLGGTLNVVGGIRIEKESQSQIRVAGANTTTVTGGAGVDVLLGTNTPSAMTTYAAILALAAGINGVNDYDTAGVRPDTAFVVGPLGNFTGCRVEKV